MTRLAQARARVVALVLVLCGGFVACAKPLHEERWLLLETDRIELLTTLSEREARAVVREVERLDALIERLTGLPRPQTEVPTRILAFARPTQLAELAAPRSIGLLSQRIAANVIVSHAPPARRAFVTERIAHQYVHASFRSRAVRPHPSWVEEGLVAVLSAARARGSAIVIGDFPGSLKTSPGTPAWGTIDELLEIGPEDVLGPEEVRAFLAQSWALVRYLAIDRYSDARSQVVSMQRHLDLLDLGISPRTAFETAFGLTTEQAGRRVERALVDGRIEVLEIPVVELDRGARIPSIRAASRSEVAVGLGEALLIAAQPLAAEREFQAAIAREPGDARAHAGLGEALRAQARFDEAEVALLQALELAPEDPRNRLDLGLVHEDRARGARERAVMRAEVERARAQYERARDLGAADAEVEARIGISHLLPGEDPGLAVDHLNRANAQSPGSSEILLALAEAHLARGDEASARVLLQRARPTCGEREPGLPIEDSITAIRARRASAARMEPGR